MYSDFFDDLNALTALSFGRPVNIKYNTGNTKDMIPSYFTKWYDENEKFIGYKATIRSVGINEDDLKIALEEDKLIISGETEYEGEKYSTHFEVPISKETMAQIIEINYKSVNGLTYIFLKIEQPEVKTVAINKI